MRWLLPASGRSGSFRDEDKPCHSLHDTPATRRPTRPTRLLFSSGSKDLPFLSKDTAGEAARVGPSPGRCRQPGEPQTCPWCPNATAKTGLTGFTTCRWGLRVSKYLFFFFPDLEIYECSLWKQSVNKKNYQQRKTYYTVKHVSLYLAFPRDCA